ncbi:MAG: hypothetical protein ACJ73S_29540 [Mycobacteriales bacterium]|jgi:hypothetical protein
MRVIIESLTRPDVEGMKAAVSRLADGPEGAAAGADDVRIELLVTGGMPGQRIQFRASIPAGGAASVSHLDDLHGVSEEYSATVPADELSTLARHLDVEALMALPPNADERYVPDSVLGSVVITAANTRITLRFAVEEGTPAADEEVAMRIDLGHGPFVLRAATVPAEVRPVLAQLATVVNRLSTARS